MSDRCRARACLAESLQTSRYCAVHASAGTISAALEGSSEAPPSESLQGVEGSDDDGLHRPEAEPLAEDAPKAGTVYPEKRPGTFDSVRARAAARKRWSQPQDAVGVRVETTKSGSVVSSGAPQRDDDRVRTRLRDLALDHKTPAAAAVAAGRAFLDPTYDADEDEDVMPAWLRDPRAYEGLTEAQHVAVLEAQPSNLAGVIRVLVDHGMKAEAPQFLVEP